MNLTFISLSKEISNIESSDNASNSSSHINPSLNQKDQNFAYLLE